MTRREFLTSMSSVGCGFLVFGPASGHAYPTRPVRLIVGFPPGATADILARLMGQWLSERLAQPFIVENRPGAGTNIATEATVRAVADGHALLLITSVNAANTTLYEKLSFDFVRDVAPVAGISREPLVMVINPRLSAKTVPDFLAYAKANPSKINMASAGKGTVPHIAGEQFKMMVGIDMVHVPYRGSAPALADLIGGQMHMMFAPISASIEFIRAGTLRALAVTTATRSEALLDVPALGDFVAGYEASVWVGLGAPRDTPIDVIDELNRAMNAGLADSNIRARLAELGATTLALSPTNFGKLIAEETAKWAKVIEFAGIKEN